MENIDRQRLAPSVAHQAVFHRSEPEDKDKILNVQVAGFDFNQGINYGDVLKSFRSTGFQATNVAIACDIIKEMLEQREKSFEPDPLEEDPFTRRRNGCTIFLGYTSNIISSGLRDNVRFLVQHSMVDCIVTTAGGVEEDLIKCLAPTYLGEFSMKGSELREKGLNRIGNLLVPNDNYCKFEEWIIPVLDEMLAERAIWTPSTVIQRLGEKIKNEKSICYWAAVNKIPIFCPALTDGSLGDMIYFHTFKNPGLIIDIVEDIRRINSISVKAKKSGMFIVGGGLVKHHICNANLMRDGADYAVYLNTGNEFDGSDSGARPDEAVSWGKIKAHAKSVKIHCDASIVFPLIVAQTFAHYFYFSPSKKQS